MIIYNALDIKIPKFPRRAVSKWITNVAGNFNKGVGDVSYIFCSDEKILEINKDYLSHDYYTDVLTFDYSTKEKISGDIFIGIETVKSNAEKFKVTFERELFRVMIHGVLHLCGMNDTTKIEKEAMRKNENQALDSFGS